MNEYVIVYQFYETLLEVVFTVAGLYFYIHFSGMCFIQRWKGIGR